MREILFRGKPVKPYAKTVKEDGSLYIEFEYGGFYRDFCYGGCPEGKDYIICFNSTGLGYNEHVLVEKTSVGQYTGLKDNNGKMIFEGDIVIKTPMLVSNEKPFKGVVRFNECEFWIDNDKEAKQLFTEVDHIEIIGNTYDNPELVSA